MCVFVCVFRGEKNIFLLKQSCPFKKLRVRLKWIELKVEERLKFSNNR
jgi:hypothetical protein